MSKTLYSTETVTRSFEYFTLSRLLYRQLLEDLSTPYRSHSNANHV